MTAPTVLDWHLRFNFGHSRPLSAIQAMFIHTTENAASTSAEDVAAWQIKTESGSYHQLVDRTKVLIENTDDWVTWSTGNRGNDVGLHVSVVGRAAWSRDQWMQEEANHGTLSRLAWVLAKWSKLHDLPLKYVPGLALRRGERGVSTHDAARIAWGVTTHTDPGPAFPMDVVLKLAADILDTSHSPIESDPMTMTPEQSAKLDRVHHELTHEFGSRVNPDDPAPYRDTSIGYILEIDKKVERGQVENLPARLDAIDAKLDQLLGREA